MHALLATKRQTETAFLSGEGDRRTFHDIVAINRELGRAADTYELFVRTRRERPALARQCADLAIDAIVDANDFELAAAVLPAPESYLLWLSERLNAALARAGAMRRGAKARREAEVRIYCHDVRIALTVLRGLGNADAAKAALVWAIALVDCAPERARVSALLTAR